MLPDTDIIEIDEDEEELKEDYLINFETGRVEGRTSSQLDIIKQYIYKALNTERYNFFIYSEDYGLELIDLYGEPLGYVYPELKRRIIDALSQHEDILEITDFIFKKDMKKVINVTFTIITAYGDITMQQEFKGVSNV